MNIATTITDLATTLKRFSTEPLLGDLFSWCSMTGTDIRLRDRLRLLDINTASTSPVSDLKARLERLIVTERGKRDRKHWSFNQNRLTALKQALATVETFQRAK